MIGKIMITIAIALSIVLVSLMSSDSTVNAQRPPRFTADTGVITPGPNQLVRLSVSAGDISGDGITIEFTSVGYTQGLCNNEGVCRHAASSQMTTPPIRLMPGEAASLDLIAAGTYGRGIVISNSRNVRVNAQIIDVATGNVDAIIGVLIS